MQNALKHNEVPSNIYYLNTEEGTNNSDILHNQFTPEIKSPLFHLYKFQDSEKNAPESCRLN